MSRLLVIDGNMILHRAFHKFSSARTMDGRSSSILFGFPYVLRGLLVKFKPENMIIFFDSGKLHHSRTDLIPNYKNRPHKIDFDYESFKDQKSKLIGLLGYLGLNVTIWDEGEGDDLAYLIYRRYIKKFDEMILVSSDKDFYQLITLDLHQWDPGKSILFTTKNFFGRKGFKIDQLVDHLVLLGDSSDKIPGYKGVGEKKTAKFLAEFGSIVDFLQDPEATFKGIDRDKLREIYTINKKVIDLKYFYRKYQKNLRVPFVRTPEDMDFDKALDIFGEYEIGTFGNRESIEIFKKYSKEIDYDKD